jgi:uroporphyrinogen-III decarboxylase
MNGRERVRATIAREPVDYVPLGFYAVDHDTVERVIGCPTLVRNKVEIRIATWEGRRDELVERFKHDSVEFYKKIDCADLILFKEVPLVPPVGYEPDPPSVIGEDLWEDRQGRIWKADRDANDIMVVHRPASLERTYSEADFEIPAEVNPPDESIFEAFDYLVEQLGQERYICGLVRAGPMPMLGPFEQAMMVYALQPEVIHAANRQMVATWAHLDPYYYREGVAGVHIEQDMAGSNGPFISPAMWREMCWPYFKERIAHIKQLADQVTFHCCGRTLPLMEMFIQAGVDCYQSLQTTAGMEIGLLKEMYGDKMSFWGGVPVEELVAGTPGEVRASVRRAMERGAPRSGFILGPSHSIAYNTKYDNFMAMLDEYVKLRDKF